MFGRRESLKQLIARQHEETSVALEEFRDFNREILLRNEKVYMSVLVRLEELAVEIRSNTEETRAQTKALLKLIDRFDSGSSSATA